MMAFVRRNGDTTSVVAYQELAEVGEPLLFDYSTLQDETVASDLRQHALSIKASMGQVRNALGVIGERLLQAREMLLGNGYPAGTYGKWVKAEFNMSARQAQHVANVARRIGQDEAHQFLLDELGRSALYQLAAPSTPDEAIEEIAQRAKGKAGSGKEGKVTLKDVKEAVSRAKQALTLEEAIDLLRQAVQDIAGSRSPDEMSQALRRHRLLRRRILAQRADAFELKQEVFEKALSYMAQEIEDLRNAPDGPPVTPVFVPAKRPLTSTEAVAEIARWIEGVKNREDWLETAKDITLAQARTITNDWMDLSPAVFRQAQGTLVARYALNEGEREDRLQVVRRELSAILLGIAPDHDWVQMLATEVADADVALAEIRLTLSELLGAVKSVEGGDHA